VILIEHHLDMIKNTDYIIDLGPGAGDKGGYIVTTGTPEEVAQVEDSLTGQYLKAKLTKARAVNVLQSIAKPA
jgi:excinuclease ABC subunit A